MKILIKTSDYKITLEKGWHHLYRKDYGRKNYKHTACRPSHFGFDGFNEIAKNW